MDDPHVPSIHLAADWTSPCKTAKPQIYRFFIYAKSYDDGMFSCKPFFIPNFATLPNYYQNRHKSILVIAMEVWDLLSFASMKLDFLKVLV